MPTDEMLHVIPQNDLKEHTTELSCACGPRVLAGEMADMGEGVVIERTYARAITVHNAWDGREVLEEVERILSE